MPLVIRVPYRRGRPRRGRLPSVPPRKHHPKMTVSDLQGVSIVLPYAPKEVEHGGLAHQYTEVSRPGRLPLVLSASEPLPTMQFEVFIGGRDHQRSVENTLDALRLFGQSRSKLTVSLGKLEAVSGPWRLTDLSITSAERQHGTNEITRAIATLSFTKAVDAVVKVGPPPAPPAPPPPQTVPPASPAPPPRREYTVKKGDTLWAIAKQFYGNGALYPRIADANKIRNPNLIYPGQKFVIP